MRVKAVDAGKVFAKAGLRVGDLITAVEHIPVKNTETFRVLLRRALAVDDGIWLGVIRNGKPVKLFVQPPPLRKSKGSAYFHRKIKGVSVLSRSGGA